MRSSIDPFGGENIGTIVQWLTSGSPVTHPTALAGPVVSDNALFSPIRCPLFTRRAVPYDPAVDSRHRGNLNPTRKASFC